MAKPIRAFGHALVVAAVCASVQPAAADLSAFIALIGFDADANLDSAPGVGVRWGQSSGFFGGETSLLISRPDREVTAAGTTVSEGATAIFYEGRLILNIPVGDVKPFVNVGFGAITILPGDLEVPNADLDDQATLKALSETETNQAFSYGAGVRYALNSRLDARFDLRQYQVFSVRGAIVQQAANQAGVGHLIEKERTVQYNELAAGIVFRF